MATSRITNTVKDASGTAIASVPVQVRLMPSGGFRISDFTEVARLDSTSTDSSGFWSLDLERNANITPANSWYEVTELLPESAGGKRVWFIAVGASDQNLLASLVTPAQQQPTVVPAGTVYLDQAAADARYQAVGGLGNSTPTAETPDVVASAGVSTSASRQDHVHALATGTPVSIALTGTNAQGPQLGIARSQHVHAYSPPACRVFRTATQSLVSGTEDTILFDSETYDTDSMHSTSVNTERITINTAGIYLFTWATQMSSDNDYNVVYSYLRRNGATLVAHGSSVGTYTDAVGPLITGSETFKCSVADFFDIRIMQRNTSAGANTTQALTTHFAATWIGVG